MFGCGRHRTCALCCLQGPRDLVYHRGVRFRGESLSQVDPGIVSGVSLREPSERPRCMPPYERVLVQCERRCERRDMVVVPNVPQRDRRVSPQHPDLRSPYRSTPEGVEVLLVCQRQEPHEVEIGMGVIAQAMAVRWDVPGGITGDRSGSGSRGRQMAPTSRPNLNADPLGPTPRIGRGGQVRTHGGRTDFLADVATKHPRADRGTKLKWYRAAVLDGEIRDTPAGVDRVIDVESARRAGNLTQAA